jgi:N-acetylated-alpha-linked acidic dipeptidase
LPRRVLTRSYRSSYPGDPTTPGAPAYENATRTEGSNIPKIPSLPISWTNAQRLLQELGGNEAGRELNGKVTENKIRLVNHGMFEISSRISYL